MFLFKTICVGTSSTNLSSHSLGVTFLETLSFATLVAPFVRRALPFSAWKNIPLGARFFWRVWGMSAVVMGGVVRCHAIEIEGRHADVVAVRLCQR